MRKLLLFLGLCCGIATASQAAFEDTNFSKYRYTVFHARYYQSSNYFYVAPLVYTVTGEGVVSVAGADLNVAEIDVPETVSYDGAEYRVTGIHGYAFQWCKDLVRLSLPKSVEYIYTSTTQEKTVYHSGPFLGCKQLKTIECKAMKAPAFWNSDAKGRNLFRDLVEGVEISTPAGSDYTSWAPYVNGLQLHAKANAAGWAGFYLNKDVKLASAGDAASILNADGGTETIDGQIPAGTPVLLKAQANADIVLITVPADVENAPNVEANVLAGTLTDITAQKNGEWYVLSAAHPATNLFEPVAAGDVIKKNTVYLPQVALSQNAVKALAKSYQPTGVGSVKQTTDKDDVYYDLSGRKVKSASKGIYIQKGKKTYRQ